MKSFIANDSNKAALQNYLAVSWEKHMKELPRGFKLIVGGLASDPRKTLQYRLSIFSGMGVCSSGLIEQGCMTSFCVISCWQSATCCDSDRDSDSEMCNMRLRFSVVQHCSF